MSEKLLDVLRAIKAMEKDSETPSICALVHASLPCYTDKNNASIKLRKLFKAWPERVGDSSACPVEGSFTMHYRAAANKTLWENPRRHALLDYLIKELENEHEKETAGHR